MKSPLDELRAETVNIWERLEEHNYNLPSSLEIKALINELRAEQTRWEQKEK